MIRNLLLCFSAIVIIGCKNSHESKISLSEYTASIPEKFFMPESLLEISGIAFNKGNRDTVYAIQDEEGKLFRLGWGVKKQYHAKFGKKGDYEDVSILNDNVYILKSNGNIITFNLADAVYEDIDSVMEWKHLLPPGEYESLYADKVTGSIYVLCKNCKIDKGSGKATGYIIQPADSAYITGTFEVNAVGISNKENSRVKSGFRPSAIARNPVTRDWFVVSAVNKLILVLDSNWNIKEHSTFNSNSFNQPEGLAFDKEGNLYISNEGDDLSQGNILKFKRNAP